MSKETTETRKQIIVAMLAEDEELMKFVKALLEVYPLRKEVHVSC